jgi:RND family efflux transporter MFP subunit
MKKRAKVPLLIVLIAVGATVLLVKSRQQPRSEEIPYLGPLVEVVELAKTSRQVIVRSTGTAQARHEVDITPQVKGRVSELSEQMVAGGLFRKGEQLFAIEDVDYKLAIDLARANLAQAELELLRNENLAAVARKEWQGLNPEASAEPDPLVVYEPQMKSARAQRDAAQANVRQAELNLQRTRVFAPFNCYVRSEKLDIGQFLSVGSPVATVAGTDQMEIVVPLSLDQLAWLEVPRKGLSQKGSRANVELQSGGRTFSWQGEVTRSMGEIDPRNRMVRVVVTVAEPFSANEKEPNPLNNLVPGMFVEVFIHGAELADVVAVPRGALRDNNTIWLVDNDNRLQIREVEVLRRERDEVLVSTGLAAGERMVLSNLSGAAEGMLLRPQLREAR